MNDDEAHQLWNFAAALYGEEGVQAACLELQDRYGLSVSLLLGAIWVGTSGRGRFGAAELEMAVRRALQWHHELIGPLRGLRNQLRRQPPAGVQALAQLLRQQLLDAELGAERIEQRLFLQDLPQGLPAAPAGESWRDAAFNAALMMRRHCPRPEQAAQDALTTIVRPASPARPRADVGREIASAWPIR
jgi:uncharacterized protein (TIGR02444 family)